MRRALIVANGDAGSRDALDAAWPGWSDGIGLVVAADGGAAKAEAVGLTPDLVVGDADSLAAEELERLRDHASVELHPVAKDRSDLELALETVLGRGFNDVLILGALGGARHDHSIANVALLARRDTAATGMALLDATTRVRLLRAPGIAGGTAELVLEGRVGDLVSLIPLGDVQGVTTRHLRYPLADEPLLVGRTRGISNVRETARARVSLRAGLLLVIETANQRLNDQGGGS